MADELEDVRAELAALQEAYEELESFNGELETSNNELTQTAEESAANEADVSCGARARRVHLAWLAFSLPDTSLPCVQLEAALEAAEAKARKAARDCDEMKRAKVRRGRLPHAPVPVPTRPLPC
jgi:septal ring factor EnvC (AmiA/AmiB activator)